MNLIQELEAEQVAKLSAGKEIPDFGPGDTVLVNVKVVEGERTRIQAYEGVCIGRAGRGLNESFTVRKISYGEGVERVFPLYSPMIDSIRLVRRDTCVSHWPRKGPGCSWSRWRTTGSRTTSIPSGASTTERRRSSARRPRSAKT